MPRLLSNGSVHPTLRVLTSVAAVGGVVAAGLQATRNEVPRMLATNVRIRAALFIDIPPLNINVNNKLEMPVLL
jgi:hypothetical protein